MVGAAATLAWGGFGPDLVASPGFGGGGNEAVAAAGGAGGQRLSARALAVIDGDTF
ncbi:hypothetical protein IHQ68_15520 [Chelatococcus sambhunathii]|uniref:Uncharacterized protein n=1 Tax=Chelatococcus sambhunathii TaxID=363953 RepID=A0ABU1DIY8_9HYPH|nr:hypothetical protein [Chelatococcus sambhunathii]MDR4308031.1 hypothetical protein [Chelatococcus sambhunathii]